MGRYGSTRYFVSKKEPDPGKGSVASLKKSGRWNQWENSKQPVIRYDQYRLNGWEIILGLGKGAAACGLLSYTFFRSFQIFLWMMPFSLIGLVIERQYRLERRQKELAGQFKEGIMLLASSLSAGFSIENALAASVEELSMLYGSNGLIVREFNFMVQQIRTNRPVEQVLEDFSARSGLEDVQNFAEVFTVAKRSSGDTGSIMRHTAEVIRDKLQVREEIITMTSSRQFEQKIMNMIPFFIVFYVEHTSPGFFDQMYGTSIGRLLMGACLAVYLASYTLAKKILAIEV